MLIRNIMQSHSILLPKLRLRYLDTENAQEARKTLLLIHGLTANAVMYEPLARLLTKDYRIIAVDLRGRGFSDKPETGYSMAEHAADIIALMDALDLKRCVVGGHSFGGLLTMFIAATFPERVERALVLDAAAKMHPEVRTLIKPSLDRLGKVFPSLEEYLKAMRAMPYLCGVWDDDYEAYYRAEALVHENGTVTARPQAAAMAEAVDNALGVEWNEKLRSITAKTLLLRAPEDFGASGTPPVVLEADARETASRIADCRYEEVPGNHVTMMFESAVRSVDTAIRRFLEE